MDDLKAKLTKEIASTRDEKWRQGRDRSKPNRAEVRWLEAASLKPTIEGPILEFGLTPDGRWVVSAADGSVVDVESTGEYLPLFPLLEVSYDKAREDLYREFSIRGLNPDWLKLFPFDRVVASALTGGSKFWPDLALDWAERLEMSEVLCNALDFLQKHGKTQQQRHRARGLLSRNQPNKVPPTRREK
jgi:hypothetical protein